MSKLLSTSFSVCLFIFLLHATAFATIFDVNSLATTNTGSGNSGTLRYCITQANQSAGSHTINFSIAGSISISSSGALLPVLNKQIIIDATTAPGYAGTPVVLLDGTGSSNGNGIEITANGCELYGLAIIHFAGRGIYVHGNNAGNFIIGAAGKGNIISNNNYYGISIDAADYGIIAYNKIGTDATGTNCAGNNYDGIDFINSADHHQVLFNHVSCNGYNGIQIGGSSYNEIKGNVIGPLSNQCQGNEYRGIDIEDGSQYNIVGGTNAADFNKIAGNLYWGIEVKNNSPNNLLSGNSYTCNDYGAIALDNNGNNGMTAPVITAANAGTITGTASPNATIQVFKSQNTNPTQCTSTPSNQGADYITSTVADASGNWSAAGIFGGYIVATATDANNNTSPFSSSVATGTSDTLMNECSGYIPSLTASFNPSAMAICEKQCISFTDQSLNAAAWYWTFEGGAPSNSSLQNPANICYSNPGVFSVTLVVYGPNMSDSSVAILYVTVNPTPTIPVITQQGDTLISTPATAYQWNLNTIPVTGATNQQYIFTQNGYYSVTITDSAGCTAISPVEYFSITGLGKTNKEWMKIFTLPGYSDMQIQIGGMAGKTVRVSVYDVHGRLVAMEDFFINSDFFSKHLILRNPTTGSFVVQLITNESVLVQKTIIR